MTIKYAAGKDARIEKYRQTKVFNTYSLLTATVVKRTRLTVTFYVHCQSCFFTNLTYYIYITPYVDNQGDDF